MEPASVIVPDTLASFVASELDALEDAVLLSAVDELEEELDDEQAVMLPATMSAATPAAIILFTNLFIFEPPCDLLINFVFPNHVYDNTPAM